MGILYPVDFFFQVQLELRLVLVLNLANYVEGQEALMLDWGGEARTRYWLILS